MATPEDSRRAGGKAHSRGWLGTGLAVLASPIQMVGSMLNTRPAQRGRPSQLFPGDQDVPMPSSNSSMPAPAEASPPPTAPAAPAFPAPAAPAPPAPAASALPAPAAAADNLHTAEPAPGSPVQGRVLLQPPEPAWSDRKKASLAQFLRVHQSQEQPPANALPAAALPDPARPYMGLKWLLRNAQSGIELPTTWTASQPQQTWQPQPAQQPAWHTRPAQAVMPQTRLPHRFTPYGLTKPAERPRFGDAGISRGAGYGAGASRMATGLPSTPTASQAVPAFSFSQPAQTPVFAGRDAAALPATPVTSGPPQALPLTPSFTFKAVPQAPAAGTAGRSTAHRAVTFGAAATPAPALVPMAITPQLGKPNAGAGTPGVGTKRAADGPAEAPARTPARTPLLGSGMNLSEYKKQRRQISQTPNNHWLARGATGLGTPRDRGDGAGSSRSNSASAAATPTGSGSVTPAPTLLGLPAPGMTQGVSPGQTEAARRILETLENYPKSDNTPVTLNKTPKPGRAGATPYHTGHPPPPLDHISPGATTPTTTTGRRYGLYDYDRPTPNGAGAPLALTPSRPTATDNGTMASPDAVMPLAAMGSGGPAADLLEGLKPAGSGRARSADRHPKSVRFSGVPDEEAGKAPAAARVQMQAPPHVQANTFTASPEPARPAAMERREGVASFGIGQAQQQQQQQAGASPRDSAVPHFTFGTDPLPADAQAAQQSWSVICTLPAGPVDTSGIKNTFAHPISAFELVDVAAPPEAGRDQVPAKGLQFGGMPAGRAEAQAFKPPEATLSAAALNKQQEELRQAAAVPLPDTDEDEAAPAQAPTASNAIQQTPVATPVASSGGWGDLLQSNLAAQAAASKAIASEIEKAKNPAPAVTTTNGFAFGFGNSAPSPTPSFSHGVPLASATVADAQSALTGNGAADGQAGQQQQQQAEPQPTAAAPAPASGGWDLSFLQKTQNGMAQASNAAAKAIEDAAKGTSTPPPSTTAGPSFGVSPLISFGASAAAPAAQTPSFGQLSPPPFGLGSTGTPNGTSNLMSPAPGAAPAFSFGAAPAQTAATSTAIMPSPTFGASAPATSTFNFGSSPFPAPAQSQPQFGLALSPAPFFGSSQPSTFASGLAGASASTPSFGAAAPAQEQQPSSSPAMFSFGATPARPTTAAAGTPATPNTPTFFGAAQTPAPTAGTAPAWGAAQPAAAAPATTSFQFGASAASTTLGLGGSGFTFGSSAPAATPPASTGGFMFGAQPQPAAQSPAPAFALSPAPGFGAPPAQGFAGAGTGFFGLSPTPAATPPANTFGHPGGSPFPVGGGGPPSVSPFGGAGGGFGGATPSPQGGFGGLATPPTLGAMNANAGSTPFPFGGAASGQAPGFGAGIAQPVFGATPSPAPAGGSGMGMNLTDMKSGERRKVHARRNK